MNLMVVGVYGGVNLKPQAAEVAQGVDVLVGTPGRLVDLLLSGVVKTKSIKKVVIDEFDEMLNLGFRTQLTNIFDKLPAKRQNLLFSATINQEVERLIDTYFADLVRVEATPVGTPLENISQTYFEVPNFYTKINLLNLMLNEQAEMSKVLVFVSTKELADRVHEQLTEAFGSAINVIHSNKSQNYRFGAVDDFQTGVCRVLIATDVIARGLDVSEVTHVINFDLPDAPQTYIHRIGRTGRIERKGIAISFVNKKEHMYLEEIEKLMGVSILQEALPEKVDISDKFLPEELPKIKSKHIEIKKGIDQSVGAAFHEKSAKNSKVNVRRNHAAEMKKKYGKAYRKSRGN